jgi:hypothetical protein
VNVQRYQVFKKRTAQPIAWGVRPFRVGGGSDENGLATLRLCWVNTEGREEAVSIEDDHSLTELADAIERVRKDRARILELRRSRNAVPEV